ncbi:winged helix-turn-helix domain-containing protein [Halomarina rubra]|uniref:Uncharacterized protein n=1 Tax=Halomarina rubra TaxID=2071873 RepID=A0ABD6ATU5_9EURY|nr:winged helix-turn-helix domain-containing protein [Halomarina rubra]
MSDPGAFSERVGPDFSATDTATWPAELLARRRWTGRTAASKRGFAPWADRDADLSCSKDHCRDHRSDGDGPVSETLAAARDDCAACRAHRDGTTTAECGHDARFKWSYDVNLVDGETVGLAEDDPRLAGRMYVQRGGDETLFGDWDNVRCPETGAVHPVARALCVHLGPTYTSLSSSASGFHTPFAYEGDLPGGRSTAKLQLDSESWGANDDPPVLELYTGTKLFGLTGRHVAGTPETVEPVAEDVLAAVLEAHGFAATDDAEQATTATERTFDADQYEPTATASDETTTDVRDVFAALERLDARDVAEATIVHRWNDGANTSAGERAFVPTWGPNANGTANIVNRDRWQDTGAGGYGGPAVMASIALGDTDPATVMGRVTGRAWWRAVEHLRSLGFDIPECVRTDGGTATAEVGGPADVALLPDLPRARRWGDLQPDRREDDGLTLDAVRERTQTALASAVQRGDRVVLDAPPSAGKSYSVVAAAAETGKPVTVLVQRGNEETYDELRRLCDEFDLSAKRLPSPFEFCPTFMGEAGEDWFTRVTDRYDRGATPANIHAHAQDYFGATLPCNHDGQCPYSALWRFDAEDYDVLLGHPTHALNDRVIAGRTVVIDEYPGAAFLRTFDAGAEWTPGRAASAFLAATPGLPFADVAAMLDADPDGDRVREALAWFADEGTDRDDDAAGRPGGGHADGPAVTLGLLGHHASAAACRDAGIAVHDAGPGFTRTTLPGGRGFAVRGLTNSDERRVGVFRPPDYRHTHGLVGLDGTPVHGLWETAVGTRLDARSVLSDDEKAAFVRGTQGMTVVRTTDSAAPVSSGNWVRPETVAALCEAVRDRHGERPALLTSAAVSATLDAAADAGDYPTDLLPDPDVYYGNLIGSNKLVGERLGVVFGSRHFGDAHVGLWTALAGETFDTPDRSDTENRGMGLSYGGSGFGDEVLRQMREQQTAQAMLRFGRDGGGATVYVHTAALPDWVPVHDTGEVIRTRSAGERAVLAACRDLADEQEQGDDGWTSADVAAHPDVDVGQRQARTHLRRLADAGVLAQRGAGRTHRYAPGDDDALDTANVSADVNLPEPPDSAADGDDDPVNGAGVLHSNNPEVSRYRVSTWDFRFDTPWHGRSDTDAAEGVDPPPEPVADGSDSPG